jgi:hypothetical protein
MRGLLLAGLCSSAIIASFNTGQAQVTVIHANNDGAMMQETKTAWVSMSSLKANLEAQGIVVNDKPQKPDEDMFGPLEAHQPNPTPTLEFTFPGAKQTTKIQALVGLAISSDGRFDSKKKYAIRDFSSDAKPGEVYLNFASLTYHFCKLGLPFSLQGWRNPTVIIGQTRFRLGDDETPMYGFNAYLGMATRLFSQRMKLKPESYTSPRWSTVKKYLHVLQVKDVPGSIYALATVAPTGDGISFDITSLVPNGEALELASPWKTLNFVSDKAGFHRDLALAKKQGMVGYIQSNQSTGLGSVKQPGNAVLFKLTGSFGPTNMGEIVMPKKPRSAAIK